VSTFERCIVSRSKQTVIDVIHPVTGLTVSYAKTLEDCRKEYPDAEEMSLADWCQWKAAQQRTPITWQETTAEQFGSMLGCLPPADYCVGGFLVGEPYDHDAGNGHPRYRAYRKRGLVYETGSRPMTIAEFREQMGEAPHVPKTG
jgi:hypothetical protein